MPFLGKLWNGFAHASNSCPKRHPPTRVYRLLSCYTGIVWGKALPCSNPCCKDPAGSAPVPQGPAGAKWAEDQGLSTPCTTHKVAFLSRCVIHDLKWMPWHTDAHTLGPGLPTALAHARSPAASSNLSHLSQPGTDPLFPVLYCISKSPQFVPWNDLQNYLTRCKQLRLANPQCLTEQGPGDRSTQPNSNTQEGKKTEDSGVGKDAGTPCKSPQVISLLEQPLPMSQLCVAASGILGRLRISTQHFNIIASSAKLRETQDPRLFSLCGVLFLFFVLDRESRFN